MLHVFLSCIKSVHVCVHSLRVDNVKDVAEFVKIIFFSIRLLCSGPSFIIEFLLTNRHIQKFKLVEDTILLSNRPLLVVRTRPRPKQILMFTY